MTGGYFIVAVILVYKLGLIEAAITLSFIGTILAVLPFAAVRILFNLTRKWLVSESPDENSTDSDARRVDPALEQPMP